MMLCWVLVEARFLLDDRTSVTKKMISLYPFGGNSHHHRINGFGHPEVYILILPGFEIICHIICHEIGKRTLSVI